MTTAKQFHYVGTLMSRLCMVLYRKSYVLSSKQVSTRQSSKSEVTRDTHGQLFDSQLAFGDIPHEYPAGFIVHPGGGIAEG